LQNFSAALQSRAQALKSCASSRTDRHASRHHVSAGTFRGVIMQIGSIVRSVHIAVPQGARGIVMRILGDMAMVAWYADEPGTSELLNTEPFFLEDLIDTGELVRPTNALMH
jgi:hypothetical protein